ncbi:hypothetical protein BASA81_003025 [Batrachochytrium salamandrivorans]|nr:hypothetical protein BASA81_003025 [Batrachochytrium salamandrivorans]
MRRRLLSAAVSTTTGEWKRGIRDPTGQLTSEQHQEVGRICDSLWGKYRVQLAVNIDLGRKQPSSVAGGVREQAIQLFNRLELGNETTNTGVLVNFDLANRAVDIVTGDGLRKAFPDGLANHAIQSRIVPELRANGVGSGAVESARACQDVLNERYKYDPNGEWVFHGGPNSASPPPPQANRLGIALGVAGLASLAYKYYQAQQQDKQRRTCEQCQREGMAEVAKPRLTNQEKMEAELGTVRFLQFECPNCQHQSPVFKTPRADLPPTCANCHSRTLLIEGERQQCLYCGDRGLRPPPSALTPTTSPSEAPSKEDGGGFSSGGGASGKW